MVEIDGFKVIGNTEPVIGVAVEFDDNALEFKLVEYYVNEYKTYLNRCIARFTLKTLEKKEFKKELGNHIRLNEVYIDETVFQMLS